MIESLLWALWLGLGAGFLHVFSGPDHLAALMPLATREPGRAIKTGAIWGAGHGLGVVALGLLGIAAKGLVDLEAISGWFEVLVGLVMVLVGVWTVASAFRVTVHRHDHDHEGDVHDHPHVHIGSVLHSAEDKAHTHAAFGVGLLHGAAGTGHLFGVLPSLAFSQEAAVVYLVAYLGSAVAAMSLVGFVLGRLVRGRSEKVIRGALALAGAVSVVVGGAWSFLALSA